MPGRKFESDTYRYGFNGKEKDKDIANDNYDFGARVYDGKIGRWLSVDPLHHKYPDLTPYNYVANFPMNAIDPDGRLIIFINGLWGWPNQVGAGGTPAYWESHIYPDWIKQVQDNIGDHSQPIFRDGSLGGTKMLSRGRFSTSEKLRKKWGAVDGYRSAKAIIANLGKDETIKIVTNSMGAAFERGFTDGLLEYRKERLGSIDGEILIANIEKNKLENSIGKDNLAGLGSVRSPKTDAEKKYTSLLSKINNLNAEKEKLQNLTVEMVIDLSPHQTNEADPNATSSYYMTAEENMSSAEKFFIDEPKHVLDLSIWERWIIIIQAAQTLANFPKQKSLINYKRKLYKMETISIKKNITRFFTFSILLIVNNGCETQAYPDARISIKKSFIDFFNLFKISDTLRFTNSSGLEKMYIVSKVDSSMLNKKGWFINGGAHNRITCYIKEISSDTIKLIRSNEISISKAPEKNLNGIVVQIGNLYYNDTILPVLNSKTIILNSKTYNEYYLINTELTTYKSDDIEVIYISPNNGIIGFKTRSGGIWNR